MHKIVLAALLALATLNVNAQHHGNAVVGTQPAKPESGEKGKFLQSHIKHLGNIGNTGRYQIWDAKVRGLDTPNLTALLAYDSAEDALVVIGATGAPGLGGALIGAAGEAGSSFVVGRAIRPSRTSVSNGSESSSNGGVAVSNAEGGDADADSDSGAYSSSRSEADADADVRNTNTNVNSNTQSQTQTGAFKPGKGPKNPKPGKGPKND